MATDRKRRISLSRWKGWSLLQGIAFLAALSIAAVSLAALGCQPYEDSSSASFRERASAPPATTTTSAARASLQSPIEFHDVKAQTLEFMGYYRSIQLTPQQQLVKREALSGIPAPCCDDNSALTCCCPCNMAKSWWGLSHHLIDQGYGAEEVKAAVEGWIEFIGPNGFSGDACYKTGCNRPFHRNGCGGMNESHVVF